MKKYFYSLIALVAFTTSHIHATPKSANQKISGDLSIDHSIQADEAGNIYLEVSTQSFIQSNTGIEIQVKAVGEPDLSFATIKSDLVDGRSLEKIMLPDTIANGQILIITVLTDGNKPSIATRTLSVNTFSLN